MCKVEKLLSQDDLFCRVILGFFGASFISFVFTLGPELVAGKFDMAPFWMRAGGWLVVGICVILTPIFLVQALAHPSSVVYILTKDVVPGVQEQHKHTLFNLLFLSPIVLITLILRAIGISGFRI